MESAILVTIAYYDVFKRPLTAAETAERLYGWRADDTEVTAEFARSPQLQRLLACERGYFVLAGRSSIVRRHLLLADTRRQKWRRAERFATVAQYLPFVRGITLGGSLAIGSARPESDIDLICIIARRRLWTARFCAMALRFVWNHTRRRPLRTPKQDKIDLLLMMTVDGLQAHRRTFYTAALAREGVTLFDEASVARRYAEANAWVRTYWPAFARLRLSDKPVQTSSALRYLKRMLEGVLAGRLGDGVEHIVHNWWSARWRRDWPLEEFQCERIVATPQVASVRAYFWEDDVMNRFHERLARVGLAEGII